MNYHHLILIVHLLAACIWVGGHLLLCLRFLPQAIKEKKPEIITTFEKKYEAIGMPALLLLLLSGLWMAFDFGIPVKQWFTFSSPIERVISAKLLLLLLTFLFALCARFFVIPKLNKDNLNVMGLLIICVTLTGMAMLILGSTVRYGGIH
ncbi:MULTISPECIES: CopD family protein [unclassified Flavobacterium]|uniref:CopD family protein n=1 Tax=unclassified Flavobacterium TaxID=196869 RepID=UPI000968EA49|nr:MULTISPECIES: CopD family protein [unclassified Flavobacterium]MBN9284411.1 CopD family protein [Flavobacterium sp.]OJV72714.1 MAG: copper resistance protein CopD [Flavobacterium sp. 40-81]